MNQAVEQAIIKELNARTGAAVTSLKAVRVIPGNHLPQKATMIRVKRAPEYMVKKDSHKQFVDDFNKAVDADDDTPFVQGRVRHEVIGVGREVYNEIVTETKKRLNSLRPKSNIVGMFGFAKTT